ncbi:MAG: CoA transferase [Chloroflexi bacterium]|nr:CoA transferase [Chloroflexota bacterium]
MPLHGITIIDLTQGIAGPMCTAQLGSIGAAVIKVERGAGDYAREWGARTNGESAIFMQFNHDKQSLAVDYARPEGLDILRDLVKTADVLVEDMKPGEAEVLGLGYEQLRLLKKDLIYCSITDFGDEGPYKDREATELELQGISGMIRWIGELDKEPVRLGADIYTSLNGMFAFGGIMAALFNKKKRHKGEKIVVSALAGSLYMIQHGLLPLSGMDAWGGYWATGPYDHSESGFKTQTRPIMFGMMTKSEEQARESFKAFCQKIGLGELLQNPYFVEKGFRTLGMGRDAQEMKPLYETAFENWDADELVKAIDKCGGLAAKYLTYEDLFDPEHDQVKADNMVVEQDHPKAGKIRLVNNPFRHGQNPAKIGAPSPALGEHSDQVLAALGYSPERIQKLRAAGVVK